MWALNWISLFLVSYVSYAFEHVFRCSIQLLLTREHNKGRKLRFSNHRLLFIMVHRKRLIDKPCVAHYGITSETFKPLGIVVVGKSDANVYLVVY